MYWVLDPYFILYTILIGIVVTGAWKGLKKNNNKTNFSHSVCIYNTGALMSIIIFGREI